MAMLYPAISSHPFQASPSVVAASRLLRHPQREAYLALSAFWRGSAEPALVQMPVGCGKTGLMAILPFGHCTTRTLLVAPNVTIRDGLAEAVDGQSADCFWKRAEIFSAQAPPPYCAVLDGPDVRREDCDGSHFVVANIQQIVAAGGRWLNRFPPDYFDLILIDEGHHNPAASWRRVLDRFRGAKIVSLTATPFRSDGQTVIGKLVYRYPFTRGMQQGYIKTLRPLSVVPSQIYFTYRDDTRLHTLEEVLRLREAGWFRRGVALGPKCNWDIVRASAHKLAELRKATGAPHQLIATTCSIDHADQVRTLYERVGLRARQLHSLLTASEREAALELLRTHRLDCIVQVEMLGEGFDHPPLSVAAVFRPFASLSPYVQFVGRIMRVLHEAAPGHPDNQGWVVSHAGLHVDRHWTDFCQLDSADQEFFRRLVRGTARPTQLALDGVQDATTTKVRPRRRASTAKRGYVPPPAALAARALAEQPLPVPEMERVGRRKPASPRTPQLALSAAARTDSHSPATIRPATRPQAARSAERSAERTAGSARREPTNRIAAPDQPVTEFATGDGRSLSIDDSHAAIAAVGPQQRRRGFQQALRLACRGAVSQLLSDLKLSPRGWQLFRLVSGVGPGSNYVTLNKLLHQRLNKRLRMAAGEKRTISAAQAEHALLILDDVMEHLREQLSVRQHIDP